MIKQLMIMPLLLANTTGTPFNLTLIKSQRVTSEYDQYTQTQGADTNYRYSTKTNIAGNNEYLTSNGTDYTQYQGQQPNGTTIYVGDNGFETLTVLSITPYNTVIDTDVTMTTNIAFQDEEDVSGEVTTDILITQENWSSYINRQNFGNQNLITTIFNEVTSPAAGYVYQQLQRINNVENLYDGNITIEYDVTLTKSKTTYIMVYSRLVSNHSLTIVQKRTINMYQNTTTINGLGIIPTGQQEIIDMPGLMFYVITLPFTFISMAFNLTLFPGTPYQINISNLLLAVIAILVFIFIMKLLISLAAKMGGA